MSIENIINKREQLDAELRYALSTMERKDTIQIGHECYKEKRHRS